MNQMNRVNSGNDFGGDNSTINIVVVIIIIIIITKMQPVATDVARSVVCVFCTQGHCAVTDEPIDSKFGMPTCVVWAKGNMR